MRLAPETRIHALSIHAEYACRHSGACCTSAWPIPVEGETFERLSGLLAAGQIAIPGAGATRDGARASFVSITEAPVETPVVAAAGDDGACAFYERDTGLCAIHRQAGASLLPLACRQFPRVTLLDGRGLFVSLTHYCPTAAALLFQDDVPLAVVEAPRSFPAGFPYDPLDARNALPPLLRPDVLLDLETFDRWERFVVATFGRADLAAEDALLAVARMTEALRTWKPGNGALERHFELTCAPAADAPAGQRTWAAAYGLTGDGVAGGRPASHALSRHYAMVLDAIPRMFRPPDLLDQVGRAYDRLVRPRWRDFSSPVRRYLAARTFGSWLSYQGRGLRTIVFSAAVALSVLKANAARECAAAAATLDRNALEKAIRRTDEMLLHLASREDLARAMSAVEGRA